MGYKTPGEIWCGIRLLDTVYIIIINTLHTFHLLKCFAFIFIEFQPPSFLTTPPTYSYSTDKNAKVNNERVTYSLLFKIYQVSGITEVILLS